MNKQKDMTEIEFNIIQPYCATIEFNHIQVVSW